MLLLRSHSSFAAVALCLLCVGATAAAEPRIAPALQPFVDESTLVGAVTLVADVEKELSLEAIGSADLAAQKPMKSDAMFWIASMTKPITAAAVMMLVDEGKVNLDDPVEKYLPEFKGIMVVAERDSEKLVLKKPAKPVTVRNILNHTSGLAHFSPLERPKLDWWPLEVRVRTYPLSPLEFEPESKYAYSNQGINTAGRIVEVVSGKSFEQFLDERLFQPLGMKDTTFFPSEAQVARIAKSYKLNESGPPSEVEIHYLTYPLTDSRRTSMPGGGLFSTAHDVGLFGRMVLNKGEFGGKRYLTEAAVKEMTSLQTGDLPTSYGLGWSVDKEGKFFGHGGAYGTNLRVDPEHGLVTVFMVQYAGGRTDSWKKVLPAFLKAAQETGK